MNEPSRMFGVELRSLRQAAGLTLEDLAAAVHYSKGHLSKVERGAKRPVPQLARACDTVLGANGALAALVPVGKAPAVQMEAHTVDEEVWLVTMDSNGDTRFLPVNRRDALLAGAASLVGLGAGIPARPLDGPAGTMFAYFRTVFDQTRELGQAASPRVVLPMVITQAHALRRLAAGVAPGARTEALMLAARYAEYAGWMAQECGDDRMALWWTDKAVELATGAGDEELGAYSLVRRSLVALYASDAIQTIGLAQQAQVQRGASSRVIGLAAQHEAQGHALAGDYDRCRRALDRAAEHLAVADRQSWAEPVLGTSTVSDLVAVATGWCLHDLGRSRQGAEILDREVPRIPERAVRARTRFGARRALAHAAAGDVDHACALTHELLDAAGTIDSATIAFDLRQLSRMLARWHRHPDVRELSPRLIVVLNRVAV